MIITPFAWKEIGRSDWNYQHLPTKPRLNSDINICYSVQVGSARFHTHWFNRWNHCRQAHAHVQSHKHDDSLWQFVISLIGRNFFVTWWSASGTVHWLVVRRLSWWILVASWSPSPLYTCWGIAVTLNWLNYWFSWSVSKAPKPNRTCSIEILPNQNWMTDHDTAKPVSRNECNFRNMKTGSLRAAPWAAPGGPSTNRALLRHPPQPVAFVPAHPRRRHPRNSHMAASQYTVFQKRPPSITSSHGRQLTLR